MENREREGGLDRIPADQVMNMPDIWGTEESEVRRQEMTRDGWVQVMRLVKSISPHRPAISITLYSGLNYIKLLLFATRGASVYLVAEQMYMLCLATPISRHQHACVHTCVRHLPACFFDFLCTPAPTQTVVHLLCAVHAFAKCFLRIIAYQCAHTHLPACIMRAAGLCVLHDPTFICPYHINYMLS